MKEFSLLVGVVLSFMLLHYSLSSERETRRFEDLALGTENTHKDGRIGDSVVHCHDLEDLDGCMLSYRRIDSSQPVLVWLGNSQLHAINQFKPGDETAALELHHRFQQAKEYFLTLSQPNASLQEHYVLFAYLLNRLPIKTLVLPVVFDDMREDGIRTSLIDVFKDGRTLDFLKRSRIGRILIENHGDQDVSGNDMAALEDTMQEHSEKILNSMLEGAWTLWAERPTLRGNFLNLLYETRNWALGINPSSTRRMIPGRYSKNRDAFLATLKLAALRDIQVLVYIVPLRNDVKIPYNVDEYTSFKSEMASLALQSGARFADLEDLVPGELWGTKGATQLGEGQELDFMHFQAGGHRLLAEALYNELRALGSLP